MKGRTVYEVFELVVRANCKFYLLLPLFVQM